MWQTFQSQSNRPSTGIFLGSPGHQRCGPSAWAVPAASPKPAAIRPLATNAAVANRTIRRVINLTLITLVASRAGLRSVISFIAVTGASGRACPSGYQRAATDPRIGTAREPPMPAQNGSSGGGCGIPKNTLVEFAGVRRVGQRRLLDSVPSSCGIAAAGVSSAHLGVKRELIENARHRGFDHQTAAQEYDAQVRVLAGRAGRLMPPTPTPSTASPLSTTAPWSGCTRPWWWPSGPTCPPPSSPRRAPGS